MLSGGDDGIGMARLAWSRLPTADGEGAGPSTSGAADDDLFSGAAVESLDYEVIENFAYREEQAQRSKFWVPYYVMLKWLFSLLIGVDFVLIRCCASNAGRAGSFNDSRSSTL